MTERIVTDVNGRKHITTEPMPIQEKRGWVGLTDEEIWNVYTQVDSMQYMEFSHAIEDKLKEKNNG